MNEFDIKAAVWDLNPMHFERSKAVASQIIERIPLKSFMTAIEYGAGTGITGFMLKDHFRKLLMIDNSPEMVRKMEEKIHASNTENVKALLFDLENNQWKGERFDLLITQMVLHHIADTNKIIREFFNILNPGGYLAIADLYPEDGSFHGEGFTGHTGFNLDSFSEIIRENGFSDIAFKKCFTINKNTTKNQNHEFDVFLLTAQKNG